MSTSVLNTDTHEIKHIKTHIHKHMNMLTSNPCTNKVIRQIQIKMLGNIKRGINFIL